MPEIFLGRECVVVLDDFQAGKLDIDGLDQRLPFYRIVNLDNTAEIPLQRVPGIGSQLIDLVVEAQGRVSGFYLFYYFAHDVTCCP
jgi:hypothetical protein